jgi:hypothetical protein
MMSEGDEDESWHNHKTKTTTMPEVERSRGDDDGGSSRREASITSLVSS